MLFIKYVSDVIDNVFGTVYYADIEEVKSFSILDTSTNITTTYNLDGTDSRVTKNFLLELSNSVYGFDISRGLWKIRDFDLLLYDTIDFVDEFSISYVESLEVPMDKTGTLLSNSGYFFGFSPVFTLASILYENDLKSLRGRFDVTINSDSIDILFKSSNKMLKYKILDKRKFNALLAKYKVLRG